MQGSRTQPVKKEQAVHRRQKKSSPLLSLTQNKKTPHLKKTTLTIEFFRMRDRKEGRASGLSKPVFLQTGAGRKRSGLLDSSTPIDTSSVEIGGMPKTIFYIHYLVALSYAKVVAR